jgi:hypothetical protein
MNRIFFSLVVLASTLNVFAQDIQSAVATRMLYFENNALVDSSAEQLTPLNYGGVAVFSGSMKYITQHEGIFYQAFYGNNRVFFRKSADGISWTNALTVTDTTVAGFVSYHPNIAAWNSAGEVQVGITYIDQSTTPVQLAFVKSSDGGETFGSPIYVSNHTDSDGIMNCGFSCKGDTLLATWTRRSGDYWERNWESHSLDGGITWSPQQIVSTGWQYSFIGDSDIDADGNFYSVLCADLGWRVELVTARSTDFGQTWQQTTQPTNLGSPNTTTNAQIMVEDSIVFISATHSLSYLDHANVHRSEDFGQTWSTIPVSDSDSLHVSNIGGGTNLYCHTSIAKGGGQRLYMAWSDSRGHNQNDQTLCDYYVYLSWSDDNGLTWSPNYRVSSASNYATTTNLYCSLSVIPGITGDDVLVSWTKNRDVSVVEVLGCMDNMACNYNATANADDGSCLYTGASCDDGNASTMNDVITAACECVGTMVGVEEWMTELRYFPNPAAEVVHVQMTNAQQIEKAVITDMQGRVLLSQSVFASSAVFQVQSLSAGRYTLTIHTAQGVRTLPLAIVR